MEIVEGNKCEEGKMCLVKYFEFLKLGKLLTPLRVLIRLNVSSWFELSSLKYMEAVYAKKNGNFKKRKKYWKF